MNTIFTELVRRNIPRVAGVYVVVGWLIMQVTAVMTPALNLPDWVDSFFAVALIIGFPIALILGWAFEMTPKGVRRTETILGEATISRKSGRKLDYVIVGGLVLVGALIVGNRIWPEKVPTPSDASIAVLPFIDLSPNQDQEYFSDGLSEELLNLLAKIPDLRVAARTSAFAFKDKDKQIGEIAEALKVGHVLEGSVRMSGERVRITAQLIDGKNGYHLWSETYDRTMDDVFEVQDDIAAQVVETLQVSLLGEVPKVHATDPKAYALYLRGSHLQRQYTEEAMEEAIKLYGEVIDIDPQYVPVWTKLSSA